MKDSTTTQHDQESIETKLLSILTSRPSHTVSPTDSDTDSIKQLIASTERTGGFTTSSIRTLFIGSWTLIATDASAVIRNNGGLTGFPGSTCSRVQVHLGKDGQAQTTENVSLLFNLIRSRIALSGKWSIEKRDALHVTYASALMFDKWRLRADSKAVLKTTYCSKRVRIGRSANNDFYVFVRDEE